MSELRKDPISGHWVVISPDQEAAVVLRTDVRFITPQETCPFCPGNEIGPVHEILAYPNHLPENNGAPWALRVIPNRLPILQIERSLEREGLGMYDRISGFGAHEIIIESPHHDLLLHDFPNSQLELVLSAWKERLNDLKNDLRMRYLSIFRNQGRRSGARISHPYSQLIATPAIPAGVRQELAGARQYFEYKDRCGYCDLIDQECEDKVRLVYQNRGFIAMCPFASRNAFEVWILPRVHSHDYGTISPDQILDLADALLAVNRVLAIALSEPDINVILKSAPIPKPRRDRWLTLEEDYHWHLEVIPRITRPTGYEWATGMFVNPTPPEEAADYLRDVQANGR